MNKNIQGVQFLFNTILLKKEAFTQLLSKSEVKIVSFFLQ
jgi:hypothetical protein